MQLYSFERFYQILGLLLAIILLVAVTTWLSAYGKRGARLASVWAMSFVLLCWMLLKAAEVVAPTDMAQIVYSNSTKVTLGLAGLVWVYFVSTSLLVKKNGQTQYIMRAVIGMAGLIPACLPLLTIFTGHSNLLSDVFAIGMPVIFYGILILLALRSRRTGFIDMLPVALSQILNNFEESVLLVDDTGKIVECSRLPEGITGSIQNIDALFDSFVTHGACKEELVNLREAIHAQNENSNGLLTFVPSDRAYNWLIRHVCNAFKRKIGTILIFCDITEQNKLLSELKEQQAQQQVTNRKLLSYNKVVENLTSERERANILLHFQNSLGYSMSALQTMLSECLSEQIDAGTLKSKIDESTKFARLILEELRQSVRTYGTKRDEEDL